MLLGPGSRLGPPSLGWICYGVTLVWSLVPLVQPATDPPDYLAQFDFFDPVRFAHYAHFPEVLRRQSLAETRQMFTFGYDCYLRCAFPQDELDPIRCRGRGPDTANPGNININDVLGDYSLTLVDSLDTLAVMGNTSEFQRAVQLVLDHVHFDRPSTVQVFEANIRILGGLLSAHLLIEDERQLWGSLAPEGYAGELLTLAHDLADRLLPAFDTSSGLPHPRVNLRQGVPLDGANESCTAGAGSLLLEFGMLSRILGDPIYESYARRAVQAVWDQRHPDTGLVGYVMNIHSGQWTTQLSGLGAGMDSFYEYLFKAHILFQDPSDLERFEEIYANIKRYLRRGRLRCNDGVGMHPMYVNVDMSNGDTASNWVDSLQASFPGLQVLHGDLDEAICHHALYYSIWKRYGCLPERYNWKLRAPDVKFYPLRPEFVESTYLLYQATKNPFYLHVGREVLLNLNEHTRTNCGYATVHDVMDKSLEDRQESFFLSETCKYLFLLFDVENPVNKFGERYLFTTEGHVFPIDQRYQKKAWEDDDENPTKKATPLRNNSKSSSCDNYGISSMKYGLPLKEIYLAQIFDSFGIYK